jgi:hypothetical protein
LCSSLGQELQVHDIHPLAELEPYLLQMSDALETELVAQGDGGRLEGGDDIFTGTAAAGHRESEA